MIERVMKFAEISKICRKKNFPRGRDPNRYTANPRWHFRGSPAHPLAPSRTVFRPGTCPGSQGTLRFARENARGSIRDPIVGLCRKFPREHMCVHKGVTVGAPPRGTLRDIPSPEISRDSFLYDSFCKRRIRMGPGWKHLSTSLLCLPTQVCSSFQGGVLPERKRIIERFRTGKRCLLHERYEKYYT